MKVFWLSDSPLPSGFGRISNEVCTRLSQRGHELYGASVLWDGAQPHTLPFWIAGLAGRDLWSYATNLINAWQPDVVVVTQDFPYAQALYYNCRIDWSRRALVVITPIDGTPIDAEWLQLVDDADATMVISRFGVEAMRQAGKRVSLCHPGVDPHQFKPASAEEKATLRQKAGVDADAFVLGMAAMNQGRKAIPHTIEGFAEFAKDKPNARLLLDMDKVSPAGWNIPKLLKDIGLDVARVIFKEDLVKRGLTELRDRFCLMDAHAVLAHREGFGLPLLESMACRIPTLAMDWCSGTEIVGDGKGYLVQRNEASRRFGTWGNALDYDPDRADFVRQLNRIHDQPAEAAAVAERGYQWAVQQTWDKAADAVEHILVEVKGKRDARQSNRARVQPAAAGAEAHGLHPLGPAAAEPGGVHPGGRLFDRVQLAGDTLALAARPDGQRAAQRAEPGFCGNGEYGGAGGNGGLAPLPE